MVWVVEGLVNVSVCVRFLTLGFVFSLKDYNCCSDKYTDHNIEHCLICIVGHGGKTTDRTHKYLHLE